ncbi:MULTISPECIES: MGMT family protein [unclassified Ornithinimicrobium]|uniref:MGMT family protein n=1 Tax=unclassified Ornithinimicrobium TaxID=2615080 RepID=UPI003851D572
MDDLLVERVLRAVDQVPPGRVVSYGDLAALVGTGPRQVGAVLRDWGSGVAWWRVTNRDGDLPGELLGRASTHWEAEGIGLRATGRGCRFAEHRADLAILAHDYARAVGDLHAP